MHKAPIPILGGLALLVSMGIAMVPVMDWGWSPWAAGMMGAVLVFLIGLYDDKYVIQPWLKMGLQSVVISWLFFNGVSISYMTLPGDSTPLFFGQITSFFVTQCWMIIIINMFNIIDGIDGLAVGVSCLTSVVLLMVSLTVSPPAVFLLFVVCNDWCNRYVFKI